MPSPVPWFPKRRIVGSAERDRDRLDLGFGPVDSAARSCGNRRTDRAGHTRRASQRELLGADDELDQLPAAAATCAGAAMVPDRARVFGAPTDGLSDCSFSH
jgi:hypothetical protein